MSFCSLGITTATVGNCVKSVGKLVNGWLTDEGSWLAPTGSLTQFAQGLCLRTYSFCPGVEVKLSPSKPAVGNDSEKPTKLKPAARSSAPRFGVVKGRPVGRASVVTPWLEPENRSR